MGLTTLLALGALTLGGAASAAPPGHRFLQLDPGAVVIEGALGLHLTFPQRSATVEAPFEVVVTGLADGLAPFELARERFTWPGMAWAFVRHDELAVWDQVAITWARPGATGSPQGGFLARLTSARQAGPHQESPLGGTLLAAPGSGPKVEGGVVTYECPKTAKKGCTVHIWSLNLQTNELEDNPITIDPDSVFTINTSLPVAHSCEGCG